MTAKRTTTSIVDDGNVIDVSGLPVLRAQELEARQEPQAFKVGDTVFAIKPMDEWSYRAELAFWRGNIETWARSALTDPSQLDALLDCTSPNISRIIRWYMDRVGVTLGEDDSSSDS
ncbi:hypothetical protein [Allonocardiopsis opalescens]|uniref:Tail assembly chaperone n=1 Tax=Allonocardiopsis opalescens TaxID=1144618 RepID=A0A2T0PT66_9ACTN|nr:hypothetical protein [Allonocardiopsis opalescens]PRX91988.1 hypothetical protein CLV72_11261 [Allonocardiopsis opalescens]